MHPGYPHPRSRDMITKPLLLLLFSFLSLVLCSQPRDFESSPATIIAFDAVEHFHLPDSTEASLPPFDFSKNVPVRKAVRFGGYSPLARSMFIKNTVMRKSQSDSALFEVAELEELEEVAEVKEVAEVEVKEEAKATKAMSTRMTTKKTGKKTGSIPRSSSWH